MCIVYVIAEQVDMWALLFVVVYSGLLQKTAGELFGNHVCIFNESFITNMTEPYKKTVTIRKYKWCLNVPPRCSYYNTEEITDTRTIEKVENRTIKKCCPGFYEDNRYCLPDCESDCENKICSRKKCTCLSGFKGEKCDTICNPGFWGSNCTENCKCPDRTCNPFTGDCINDTFLIIETKTDMPKSISDNRSESNSRNDPPESNNNSTTVENEYFYDDNVLNSSASDDSTRYIEHEEYDNDITTISTVTEMNTLRLSTKLEVVSDIPITLTADVFEETVIPKNLSENNNTEFTTGRNFLMNDNREYLIPVQIKYDNNIARPLIKNDLITTTDSNNFNTIDRNHSLLPVEGNLVNIVSISAATTTAIILLAIVLFSILQIKKSKKETKEDQKKNVGVSTVSVYATSIFHTPLPDPPTYEEKLPYLTPTEYQNCSNELKSFQTHIVCNVNKQTPINSNPQDYTYDHPPSTGSYRAASVIDSLDADINHGSTAIRTEPVYDEIPCQRFEKLQETSYYSHPKSLYMNTHGITKF